MSSDAQVSDTSDTEVRTAEVVEALLEASRAMVAIAARSVAELAPGITLPQYRALMVLRYRGPQRVVDIAAELGVNPSTGTRMCDRLVAKGLVRRDRVSADRRVVRLVLSPAGQALVDEVTRRRRADLARIVAAIPREQHAALVSALGTLTDVTGHDRSGPWPAILAVGV